MADNYSLCLVGVMDRLWFHKLILFSESTTLLISKTLANSKPHHLTEPVTYKYSPSSSSVPSLSSPPHGEAEEEAASPPVQEEIPLESPPPTTLMVKHQGEEADQFDQKDRPTRLNHVTTRARSHSSFPFTDEERRPRKHRHSGARRRLKKSRSCRSLGDLELEEVKGFMDLGFVFKKEHVSPRMLSVLPGLQRLWFCKAKQNSSKLRIDSEAAGEAGDCKLREDDEKKRRAIIRPYLSEAWLIKRPDSPLLNLRVPRVSAAADMKNHLKFWARTVASVVEQES